MSKTVFDHIKEAEFQIITENSIEESAVRPPFANEYENVDAAAAAHWYRMYKDAKTELDKQERERRKKEQTQETNMLINSLEFELASVKQQLDLTS